LMTAEWEELLLSHGALELPSVRADTQAAWANIKPMPNRRNPPAFSPFLYRYRNLVERFFNKIKHYRAIATRYEKRAANYLALVKLASIRIWLRHNESVT
jgi:transposase